MFDKLISRALLTTLLFILSVQHGHAETVMYCSTELSTGFLKKNNKYEETSFVLDRYTVKVVGDFNEVIIGEAYFDCRASFGPDYLPHIISCFHTAQISESGNRVDYGGLPELFHYNKQTQKFVYADVSTAGFAGEDAVDTDTLSAGRCERF